MQLTSRFAHREYDVLIIGGGINGAAVANIASHEGLKVALIEKNDFASGTSSKSTKLMHGGLRYLENFEFDLVKEALKERTIQLQSAPHLVKPLEFIIPVYKTSPRPFWMMKLGVALYDFLSGKYRIGQHRKMTPFEVGRSVPDLEKEGLLGGVSYFDAQMDDARVCLENILSAKSAGADVANYVEFISFMEENGSVIGARVRDVLSRKEFNILSRNIVCAAGPWANEFLQKDAARLNVKVRATKGIHIVYNKIFSKQAILLQVKEDKRIFFVIPWKNHSLIGTTDTDYDGDLNKVEATEEDINYLFKELQGIFPAEKFDKTKIITTFAGLRPLVFRGGHPSEVSRKHVIAQSVIGVTYILGGKFTTYRKIAKECLEKVLHKKIDMQSVYPLYGGGDLDAPAEIAKRYNIDRVLAEYLQTKYGSRVHDVLKIAENNPALKEKICTCSPAIKAQVVYSIEHEMAKTAEDIIARRLEIIYEPCTTKQCRKVIDEILNQKEN